MRLAVPNLICVAGLVLQGAGAGAETWTLVRGKLIEGKATRTLSGSFTGSVSRPDATDEPDLVEIDDFSLSAGRRSLAPDAPIEDEGLAPTGWVSAADQIGIDGDRVTFVQLRTGGERVGGGPGYVTFRFLDLRADASHGGLVEGRLPDSDTPRRVELNGDVYQVEQSFLRPPPCPPISPGSGGGSSGSVTIIATGHAAASVPYDTSFVPAPFSVPPTPTLEQLGMRAPDGAEITLEGGALRVTSTGDLFVEGTLPETPIPGLTSVTLTTPARIIVTGHIVVPGGSVGLNGGEVQVGSGSIDVGDPSTETPACQRLTPILPAAERVVGRFSLVASAARQMKIDVIPGGKRNRVLPGADGAIPVAILGSRTLDVADVDPDSMRLGAGEAGALPLPVGPSLYRLIDWQRANGDHFVDMMRLFSIRDAGIAYGDRELCLVARTRDGEPLEGCDRIDTTFGLPAAR